MDFMSDTKGHLPTPDMEGQEWCSKCFTKINENNRNEECPEDPSPIPNFEEEV